MRRMMLWAVIALVLVAVLTKYMPTAGKPEEVRYSTFLNEVRDGRVDSVVLQGDTIYGVRKDHSKFQTYNPETNYTALIEAMRFKQAQVGWFSARAARLSGWWMAGSGERQRGRAAGG